MPEQVDSCPLCMGETYKLIDERFFRGIKVFNQVCQRCGFVFQSPRMTAQELDDFYIQHYRQVYQGSEGPNQKDLAIQAGRASALLDFVKNHIPSLERHLDIGCSAGILLKKIQTHYGCKSYGVEPGEAYRAFAQHQGFEVYTDLADLKVQGLESFDLISMAHVLEHLPNPVGYLTELRQKLIPKDGYLLLEVPNLFVHDSFETAHLSSFSQHTLSGTLTRAGFSILALKTHGAPRSKLLPLYITALAQAKTTITPYQVKREGFVRQKRALGIFVRRQIQRLLPNMAWIPIEENEKYEFQ